MGSTAPPATGFRAVDSPWFWGLAFCAMALLGIGLIAPKYEVRQRQIEGRFLGRQRAAIERERRAAGLDPVDLADTAVDPEDAPPRRIVPLWSLAVLAALGTGVCALRLAREARAARPPSPR